MYRKLAIAVRWACEPLLHRLLARTVDMDMIVHPSHPGERNPVMLPLLVLRDLDRVSVKMVDRAELPALGAHNRHMLLDHAGVDGRFHGLSSHNTYLLSRFVTSFTTSSTLSFASAMPCLALPIAWSFWPSICVLLSSASLPRASLPWPLASSNLPSRRSWD